MKPVSASLAAPCLRSSRPLRACGWLLLAALCAPAFAQDTAASAPAAPSAAASTIAPTAAPASAPLAADDRLFLELGGQPGLVRLVDDFVPRLVADRRLGEFFRKSRQPHLKEMLVQQFCAVSGGPCVYTGIPMKAAHQDMDIARSDFNALVEALQASMDAQGLPFSTQNRLLARLAPMHREIVNVH